MFTIRNFFGCDCGNPERGEALMYKIISGAGKNTRHKNTRATKIIATLLLFALAVYSFSYMLTAKNTYIITDGDTTLVLQSYEQDAEAVITEAGISLDHGDAYSSETDENGVSEIIIKRAKAVTLYHNGAYSMVTTRSATVGEFLASVGIVPSENEVMDYLPEDAICEGMTITITVTEITYIVVEEEIPFDTHVVANGDMEINTIRYIQEGSPGIKTITYKTIVENGVETQASVPHSEEITLEPVNAIIEYGAKQPAAEATGTALAADKSASAAEGASDSGNSGNSGGGSANTAPVSSASAASGAGTITTASGEVIAYTKALTVKATAYTTEGRTNATTATGTTPRVGAVAVDPEIIPYGTLMYIIAEDGSWIYGYAVAEDCGSFTGNRVDIYYDTYDECVRFGRQNAMVYIIG